MVTLSLLARDLTHVCRGGVLSSVGLNYSVAETLIETACLVAIG